MHVRLKRNPCFSLPTQSVFGKGLTTILNEYVATRTKGEIFWRCPLKKCPITSVYLSCVRFVQLVIWRFVLQSPVMRCQLYWLRCGKSWILHSTRSSNWSWCYYNQLKYKLYNLKFHYCFFILLPQVIAELPCYISVSKKWVCKMFFCLI